MSRTTYVFVGSFQSRAKRTIFASISIGREPLDPFDGLESMASGLLPTGRELRMGSFQLATTSPVHSFGIPRDPA
jgi:hypothetical protein